VNTVEISLFTWALGTDEAMNLKILFLT
jgi:hypothetical protein